jgi:hypothetical protein
VTLDFVKSSKRVPRFAATPTITTAPAIASPPPRRRRCLMNAEVLLGWSLLQFRHAANFGRVTSASSMRQMELGVRVTFWESFQNRRS